MLTIDLIKMLNRDSGLHFFDSSTMRFFSSRCCSTVHDGPGGVFFVTSEKRTGFGCADGPRRYTVRRFDRMTGEVRLAGNGTGDEFQKYSSSRAANRAAKIRSEG
jgi:hypothetical protein